MALFDAAGLFSENQAITATAASTNSVDFGANGTSPGNLGPYVGDLGNSDIQILAQVTQTFATLTSLTVSVQMDDNSAFSSPTTITASQAVPVASLVAGYKFRVPFKIPEGATERHIRLNYTVAGSNATAGTIYAGIVASRPGAVAV